MVLFTRYHIIQNNGQIRIWKGTCNQKMLLPYNWRKKSFCQPSPPSERLKTCDFTIKLIQMTLQYEKKNNSKIHGFILIISDVEASYNSCKAVPLESRRNWILIFEKSLMLPNRNEPGKVHPLNSPCISSYAQLNLNTIYLIPHVNR